MDEHTHTFRQTDWPFTDPVNTTSFTTDGVLRKGLPVVLVSHDEEGDWQFLCETPDEERECLIVCLGCAYQRDPSVGELADLPVGWRAWRDSPGEAWHREPCVES